MLGKQNVLALTALLAGVPDLCSGFQSMPAPRVAGAIRLEKAAGRTSFTSRSFTSSSPSSSSRVYVRCGDTRMSLLKHLSPISLVNSGINLVSSIFCKTPVPETTLPNDPDANKEARAKQLAEQQELYQWRLEGTPIDMPYLADFPPDEQSPTLAWVRMTGFVLIKVVLGAVRGTIGIGEVLEAIVNPKKLLNFAQRIQELIGLSADKDERPVDMDDYNDLHAFPLRTPDSAWDYDETDAFARQRLQGANAIVLEKCTKATRNKLRILDQDDDYKELKHKVNKLMKQGKLFVVDHELLTDMAASSVDETPRYLAHSIALFEATDDELLPLKAIGIQLDQGDKKNPKPIFTPEDEFNWKIAMSCFEASDFIIHETVSHLGFTHVVMEAPMVAMNRQLPSEHPLFALLDPHFEGTALINWGAHNLLMAEGGAVDSLTATKIDDLWTMVKEQTTQRISKDFSPVADFKARGMTHKEFPGRYPYRDYGLKYWHAIYTWVTDYLNIYYPKEKVMNGDYELKAFINELANVGGHTHLKGWSKMKKFRKKKDKLAKYLASLIYTGSVLHAAVNFPQKSLTSYVPNTPAAVYQPIPEDKETRTFQDYLSYLPTLEAATSQVVVTTLLGSIIYTRIGEYDNDQFTDERVQAPLEKFQLAIDEIEEDISEENAHLVSSWKARGKDKKDARNFGYKTLLPNNVPQSINI